jgi:hypothetical protein
VSRERDAVQPEPAERPATAGPGAPELAPAGLSMAAIARQPPEARAAIIGRLSQAGGNRAVVARIEDSALAGPEIVKGWSAEADEKIKIDLDAASDAQKLAEVQRLMSEGGAQAIGEADTTGWAIGRVWKSFGTRMWEFALANRPLFETSLARAADLVYFEEGWGGLRERFKVAVEGRVTENLDANHAYVRGEMEAMGLNHGMPTVPLAPEERDRGLREMQIKAERVGRAQEGMAKARTIPVGTKYESWGGGPDALLVETTDYFDPANQPQSPGGVDGAQEWASPRRTPRRRGRSSSR